MTKRTKTLTSVESVWAAMEAAEEYGGSRRIDASYPHDAFCTVDLNRRRGLLLLVDSAPDHIPLFDAMEIVVAKRADDRIGFNIVLLTSSLKPAFVGLSDGLLVACEESSQNVLSDRVIAYLVHANTLLEFGDPQALSASALRGLIGELIVLTEIFDILPVHESVLGWTGPLKTPQDFVFADRLIETKAKTPITNRINITSLDQLEPITLLPLTLAVVTISSLQDDLVAGTSPSELVDSIRDLLQSDPIAVMEFDRRLKAANYFPRPYYVKMKYRLISIRFYKVSQGFPRIRQSELASGIVSASYEIDLGSCDSFEIALEDSWI